MKSTSVNMDWCAVFFIMVFVTIPQLPKKVLGGLRLILERGLEE
jgi:hypothetical protein